jgi:hypothetical protein
MGTAKAHGPAVRSAAPHAQRVIRGFVTLVRFCGR